MPASPLQEPFLREWVESFQATKTRLLERLVETPAVSHAAAVEHELRGLFHGLLVTLDGGTALADQGLVRLTDEDGVPFDRFLHEICSRYWPRADG